MSLEIDNPEKLKEAFLAEAQRLDQNSSDLGEFLWWIIDNRAALPESLNTLFICFLEDLQSGISKVLHFRNLVLSEAWTPAEEVAVRFANNHFTADISQDIPTDMDLPELSGFRNFDPEKSSILPTETEASFRVDGITNTTTGEIDRIA